MCVFSVSEINSYFVTFLSVALLVKNKYCKHDGLCIIHEVYPSGAKPRGSVLSQSAAAQGCKSAA
jgi:hypothetical protein